LQEQQALEAKPDQPGSQPAAQHGHEKRDAPMSGVLMLGAVFVVLLIFGLLVSLGAFRYFTQHEPMGPPASPFENVRSLPPTPRLQVTPAVDLRDYLKGQQELLNSYGWVDQKAGIVRIPIDRAMELLLEKGLPVRTGSAAGDGSASGPAKRDTVSSRR
jgi:hypothetical protein